MHPVGFAIIRRDPELLEFGHTIGAPRIERGRLILRDLADGTIEFGSRGLIKPRALFQAENANRFEKAQRTERISIGGVFRGLETHLDVALSGEIVDFGWLGFLNDANEICGIGHVAVVQRETHVPRADPGKDDQRARY